MTTPPPEEPLRIILANRAGQEVGSHTVATAGSDAAIAGRFTELIKVMKTWQLAGQPAKLLSGMLWATIPLELLTLLNTGNPEMFTDKSHKWEQIAKDIDSIWTDLTDQYNKDIPPYWQGDAKNAMDTYLNKTLMSAHTQLKGLAEAIPPGMAALASAMWTADMASLGFTIASAIFLNAAAVFVVETLGVGEPVLITAVVAYCTGLVSIITQIGVLFWQFQAQLTPLQQKAGYLLNALYREGDKSQGSRLNIDPELVSPSNADDNYWKHNPALDA
jgi:hypothetical protein